MAAAALARELAFRISERRWTLDDFNAANARHAASVFQLPVSFAGNRTVKTAAWCFSPSRSSAPSEGRRGNS